MAGGFLTLMLAGSTGGHLAGKRSTLDGILHALGVNTHLLFTLSTAAAYAILIASVSLLAAAAIRRLIWGRGRARRAT